MRAAIILFIASMASAQTNMGPVRTPQINQNLFVGQSGYATIQSAVTFACKTGDQTFAVIIPAGSSPSDTIAAVTGGCSATYISDQRTEQIKNYRWSGTGYVAADVTVGGNLIVNGTTNALRMAAGSQVASSPICTEASGCPGTNVTYPPAGIGVSTGTAWDPISIDPTTLIVKDASGNLAFPGAITSVRGTRLPQGTDLNTLNTCGDFDGFDLLNVPPQLPSGGQFLNNVGIHVWCTGDPDYVVQLAWNMTQWGQPTEIFARNYRAGAWTTWTSFIFDDGSGNVAISGSIDSGRVLTLGTPQDLNAISRQGIYYLPAGCSANCPNPPDHTLDPRDGFLLQGISPGNAIWQQFQSPNDWILGTIYIRTYIRGVWSGWTEHLPSGSAFMRTCATCAYHLVDLAHTSVAATISPAPLTASGKQSSSVAATPKDSKQTCRKDSMWHDAGYIYVCVKNGEVKRAALSSF